MKKKKINKVKLDKIASSKITSEQYEYLKDIKNKFNFKSNSECIRYLIELHKSLNLDGNRIVAILEDSEYEDFLSIKKANGFLTDTEAIVSFIKIQRSFFQELGSWNY